MLLFIGTWALLFILHCFPFGREATDSYTIIPSPNFGMFRVPSILQTSLQNLSSSLDMDAKAPLLSDQGGAHQNEDFDKISRIQSLRSERASFSKQLTGELPISRGCSFTQTIFNGSLCFLFVLLHTYVFSEKILLV